MHDSEETQAPDMIETAAPAPATSRSEPSRAAPARRATKFMAELSHAMQAAAEHARNETMERFEAEAKAVVEEIHANATTEVADLRRKADDDVAAIRDWSKAEIARIREETEARVAARKTGLDAEMEAHATTVEARAERVTAVVAAFETEMAAFFDRLNAEEDPTRIATMAETMPDPPSLEAWPHRSTVRPERGRADSRSTRRRRRPSRASRRPARPRRRSTLPPPRPRRCRSTATWPASPRTRTPRRQRKPRTTPADAEPTGAAHRPRRRPALGRRHRPRPGSSWPAWSAWPASPISSAASARVTRRLVDRRVVGPRRRVRLHRRPRLGLRAGAARSWRCPAFESQITGESDGEIQVSAHGPRRGRLTATQTKPRGVITWPVLPSSSHCRRSKPSRSARSCSRRGFDVITVEEPAELSRGPGDPARHRRRHPRRRSRRGPRRRVLGRTPAGRAARSRH